MKSPGWGGREYQKKGQKTKPWPLQGLEIRETRRKQQETGQERPVRWKRTEGAVQQMRKVC